MLKAYVDLMSQPARALYIFLKHTKIPHTVVPVALRKGEHLEEEYFKINPFKQVPVIDDEGFKLNESYLCDKHEAASSLYPKDLTRRAKINAFNNWQHLNIRLGGALIFRSIILNLAVGKSVDENSVAEGSKILKASLEKMETIFLEKTPFIYSDTMTIADLLGVCELMQPALGVGVDVFTGYPKVEEWFKRVKSTVGADLFDDAHKFIVRGPEALKAFSIPTPKL